MKRPLCQLFTSKWSKKHNNIIALLVSELTSEQGIHIYYRA